MANEISKLKEYNLEEISKTTKIPLEYLESMLKNDYAKLINVNVKAYTKIISREYGIDTSGFLSNFESFVANTNENQTEKVKINPRLHGYCAKEKSNSTLWLILMLILMALGIWGSKMLQNIDFSHLVPDNITIHDEDAQTNEANATNEEQEDEESDLIINDISQTDQNQTSQIQANEANATSEPAQTNEQNQIEQSQIEQSLAEQSPKIAHFTPKKSIWIGIKNLDDMQKRSFNAKQPFDINLTGNMLLVTGHGRLSLSYDEQNKTYNQKDTLRFHITNGEIKKLNFKEFIKLNKGPLW
ncbi:hypothetical protein CINF_1606 [Candidatus Campylobacter infans]|uniref:Helix-turn-helix domain-containing protein n=1 Tax=Candidatus Campylobacter infans TaxID=2561898 RepID=A0A7H9CIY7_9BACT|nr:hypothetical protein [Candidatus Campylobacter infans]QLI06080.1 hypothetical protein CINF_1606 [Candidatus Campylobacter infans]